MLLVKISTLGIYIPNFCIYPQPVTLLGTSLLLDKNLQKSDKNRCEYILIFADDVLFGIHNLT